MLVGFGRVRLPRLAIIDSIKSTVPIWKKEHYTDGTSAWVKCHSCAEHGHSHGHHH